LWLDCCRGTVHDWVSISAVLSFLITNVQGGFIFFFSSRRRHTSCYRDWSSDVCSSDLGDVLVRAGDRRHEQERLRRDRGGAVPRSEERRVGKEGKSGWSPDPQTKKKNNSSYRFAGKRNTTHERVPDGACQKLDHGTPER